VSAERLFEEISPDVVQAFLQEGREEDLSLDFKLVAQPAFSSREDRRSFARALSGFANSDGGVILWGCDARKGKDDIDRLQSIPGVADPDLAIARLNELTGDAVRPIVDGVRHRRIDVNGVAVIATLIPRSDTAPHMAKCGENRYFKRSGDSFYPLEHFDIADMFGRRPQPRLGATFTVRPSGGSGRQASGVVVVAISNAGRGIATAPALHLKVDSPFRVDEYGLTGNHQDGLPRIPRAQGSTDVVFAGSTGVVVHAGTDLQVCSVRMWIDFLADDGIRDVHDLRFEYLVTCAEGVRVEGEFKLTAADIAEAILIEPRLSFVRAVLRDRALRTDTKRSV
jgi:Putative DNA-binding domain